ncbi:GNAT family N-acetyltransferase [Reichenbachiella sp.]
MKIQVLKHHDIEMALVIWQLFQRSYKVEADLVGTSDFPPLQRSSEAIQKSDTLFYGIWEKERLAAAIEVSFKNELLDVCSLVIDPDFFRQGLARQLLDFVEDEFNPQSCEVETASANMPAIKLYQKHGYVLIDQWMTSFNIEKVKLVKTKTS